MARRGIEKLDGDGAGTQVIESDRPRILVVDDEKAIVDLITFGLSQHGFEVIPAYSPMQAWTLIKGDTTICVILTDFRMPEQSGISLASDLLWDRQESVAIEVVVMTGGATADVAIDAVRVRAFDFIKKPFRMAEVIDVVRRAAASAVERRRRAVEAETLRDRLKVSEQERQALTARLSRLTEQRQHDAAPPADAGIARTLAAALHDSMAHDNLSKEVPATLDATNRYAFVVAQAADQLDDRTLLEFLLTLVATPDEARRLAERLMATFEGYAEVLAAPIAELTRRAGLTRDQAVCIKAVNASAVRLLRTRMQDGLVLEDWDQLSAYVYASLASERVENFRVLYLDNRNRLLADDLQARGTLDFVAVHTREVIKRGLELHAAKLILVHNHPSGDARPSRQDIALTKEISRACAIVDIAVGDHLIVGRTGITSLRAAGYL
ncbi:RadC family protein [Elioraea sp.]|uniref:RadC family protein n=1 Tax=Elioraea sp. TaxID=2185103 RepID=UPI003F716328